MLITYRNATLADLPAIVDIYNSTVVSRMVTADTEPVTAESKVQWYNDHQPPTRPLWIAEDHDKNIIGWVSFQNFYGRPAYNATAELSIYLKESCRGKGYGRQILQHSINSAPALGIKTLLGFIFLHNEASVKLFHHAGFSDWGTFPSIAELDGIERTLVIMGKRVG